MIAIATLLVAVVGATFAYFTATATGNDQNTGKVDATTVKLDNVTLTASVEGTIKGNLDYPGGVMVAATKVVATSSGEGENNYKINYDLKISGENGTGTDVKWYLLRAGDGIGVANVKDPSCELKIENDVAPSTLKYYYGDKEDGTCSAKSYLEDGNFNDLQLVAYGTLTANTSPGTELESEDGQAEELGITKNTPEGLEGHTLYTTASSNKYTTEYYYLVVEYPNKETEQNSDQKKKISVSISSIENIVSTIDTTE